MGKEGAERHRRRERERRRAHHEATRDIAAERACAEEQHTRACDALEVERGQDAPAHELEVEADGLVGEAVTSARGQYRCSQPESALNLAGGTFRT